MTSLQRNGRSPLSLWLGVWVAMGLWWAVGPGARAAHPRPNAQGGRVYYVATTGSDSNDGSFEAPFRTLQRALAAVRPGDTILIRGGVYDLDNQVDAVGTAEAPITIASYPGEWAVFDGSAYDPSQSVKFRITGSWLILRRFEVRYGPSDGFLLTENAGYNRLENLVSHGNYLAGFELENGAHDNLILNCDSYENFDSGASHGEHADGFGAKYDVGPGNRFEGCRAWNNSDDGFDFWAAEHRVVVAYSWAYGNGFDRWGVGEEFAGDGNGFKLGPHHPLIHHCLAWNNAQRGFDDNDATDAIEAYNNTSYGHPVGFRFVAGPHVLRNNLSFQDGENQIAAQVDDAYNSWNDPPGIEATPEDFVSLDDRVARGPRRPDGSLPSGGFLRPRWESSLRDRGVDVGLPYRGQAPDLGGREAIFGRRYIGPPVSGGP